MSREWCWIPCAVELERERSRATLDGASTGQLGGEICRLIAVDHDPQILRVRAHECAGERARPRGDGDDGVPVRGAERDRGRCTRGPEGAAGRCRRRSGDRRSVDRERCDDRSGEAKRSQTECQKHATLPMQFPVGAHDTQANKLRTNRVRDLFGYLVHVLRVRRRALGLVARRGWTATTFIGETLALLLIALVLELLAFIHDRGTRTARAISHPGGRAVLSS